MEKHSTIRQADSGFLGVDVQENSGEPLKLDHAFAFCVASFLMTIATGRIPHAGSRRESLRVLENIPYEGCSHSGVIVSI